MGSTGTLAFAVLTDLATRGLDGVAVASLAGEVDSVKGIACDVVAVVATVEVSAVVAVVVLVVVAVVASVVASVAAAVVASVAAADAIVGLVFD